MNARLGADDPVENAHEFAAIFESAYQLILITDAEGNLVRANETARDYDGLDFANTLGRPIWTCPWARRHPEIAERIRYCIQVTAAGESIRKILASENQNGHPSTFDFSFRPMRGPDGTIGQILIEGHDVTDLVRASRALKRSEARLCAAQQLGSMGDWTVNLESGEIEWSDQVYRLFERDPAAGPLPFEDLLACCAESSGSRIQAAFERALTTGEPADLDIQINLPTGRVAFHQYVISPQRNAAGRVTRISGIVHDITQRKLAEEHVRDLNTTLETRVSQRTRELEDAVKELESFTYSVSHDLRAPLRGINGFAEILARDWNEEIGPAGQRCIDHIIRASNRMGRLIDDLLKYSRMGQKAVDRRTLDLNDLLAELAAEFSPQVESIDATLEIESGLPEISGDPTLIRQVFANLLDNALSYTHPGRRPQIRIARETDHNDITVSITDNGLGIESAYFEKIFEIFQRLHTDRDIPGTGIGLAIVRKAASLSSGRIWLESRPGTGTRFFVQLPPSEFGPPHDSRQVNAAD